MQHSSVHRPSQASRLAIGLVLLGFLAPGRTFAYPDGPPDGFAGNPPNYFSCVLCHGSYDVNSGDGSLELLGLPPAYAPGATYDLTVRLHDAGQIRWGFEITAFGPGNQAAGTFTITDAINTQLSDNAGTSPDYMKHTLAGTRWHTPDGPVTWSFRWTAPAANTATFYLAGNAAEGGNDPSDDYIYTLVRTLEQETVGVTTGTWTAVKSLYRR